MSYKSIDSEHQLQTQDIIEIFKRRGKAHGCDRWYKGWYEGNEPLLGTRGDMLPSTVLF